MCLNPIKMSKSGKYKEDNYNGLKGEDYSIVAYSKCGHCAECINEKANNWVIRNWYEAKAHKDICFITLTYKDNPEFLIKKHFQDFMKRLRRRLEYHYNIKVRMFFCGEYGTLRHRPHGHAIIYGLKLDDDDIVYLGLSNKGYPILQSKLIQDVWSFGRTTVQFFDVHEIPYITLYDTANTSEKSFYIASKKKVHELLDKLKDKNNRKYADNPHRRIMIKTLENELKLMEKNKQDYLSIKEFNLWSKGLGFDEFLKEYYTHKVYDFEEYIEDKEFCTPSSWVKKLANKYKDEQAIAEMRRRLAEMDTRLSSEDKQALQRSKYYSMSVKDIEKFAKTKDTLYF